MDLNVRAVKENKYRLTILNVLKTRIALSITHDQWSIFAKSSQ